MLKRVMPLFMALFLLCPMTACGENEADIKQIIQSRYDQFDVAYKGRDRKNIEDIFAPECVFKQNDEGRKMTLPKFMNAIEFSFRAMTIYYINSQIETIKLDNDTAQVTVSSSTDADIITAVVDGEKKESKRAKTTKKYQDTWKKTPQGWRIVQRLID